MLGCGAHVDQAAFRRWVRQGAGYLLLQAGKPVGVLQDCVLWDHAPFLNLLFLQAPYRGQGLGAQAMAAWEAALRRQGFAMALVSTQADEGAQHFFRKLGYVDCGALFLHGAPLDQCAAELFLRKAL